jgi:hypothetical protein
VPLTTGEGEPLLELRGPVAVAQPELLGVPEPLLLALSVEQAVAVAEEVLVPPAPREGGGEGGTLPVAPPMRDTVGAPLTVPPELPELPLPAPLLDAVEVTELHPEPVKVGVAVLMAVTEALGVEDAAATDSAAEGHCVAAADSGRGGAVVEEEAVEVGEVLCVLLPLAPLLGLGDWLTVTLRLSPVSAREEVGKREGVALPDTVTEAVEEGEREGEPVLLPVAVLEPVGELLCEALRVLLELTVLLLEAVPQGLALTVWLPLRVRLGLLVREEESVEDTDKLALRLARPLALALTQAELERVPLEHTERDGLLLRHRLEVKQ